VVDDHAHQVIVVFHLALHTVHSRRYGQTPPEARQPLEGTNEH
jgi:hypothetical protein